MKKSKAQALRLVRNVVRQLTPSDLGSINGGMVHCMAPSGGCALQTGDCQDGNVSTPPRVCAGLTG